MAVNYGLGLGPILEPNFDLQSWSFIDDFLAFADSNTEGAATWWDVSNTGTQVSTTSERNGAVALTVGSEIDDDAGIQLAGEPITFDHSRDMLFGMRVKFSATTGIWLAGLHAQISSGAFDISGTGTNVNAHIAFLGKGDANIHFSGANGTSQTTSDTTDDITASTYVILAAKYSAVDGKFRYFVNGNLRGSHSIESDNLPADDTQLTLGLHNESTGSSVAMIVDYIYVIGER